MQVMRTQTAVLSEVTDSRFYLAGKSFHGVLDHTPLEPATTEMDLNPAR